MLSLLFGAIVGVSLGLTGGGGAIFAVPLLVYGLDVPAREAVGISLISVGITSLAGFVRKWKHGESEVRTGLLFATAGMVGAPIGSWLAGQLPEALLMLLFSGLMLLIAGRMWMQSKKTAIPIQTFAASGSPNGADAVCSPEVSDEKDGPSCQRDATGQLILSSRCARLLLLVGVGSGILSGMFGVGGGFIIVPALVIFSGMSMSRAVGTSLLVISLVSVSGVASQLWAGQRMSVEITTLFVIGGMSGLWCGQSVAHRLSASALQRVFSVAILIVAIFVIFKNSVQG